VGDLTAEMVKRYKAKTGADQVPPHTSMGFNHTWVLLHDVVPIALNKYGGWDAESLRKAVILNNGHAKLEASGGITLDNVRSIAQSGVDYISIGSLTKDIKAIDLSMKFRYE